MTHPIPGPRRVWKAIVRPGRRLRLDRRGAVAVFLAFAVIPMIGFVGIATDTARAYLVKSRLSSALDSAGLAGGYGFFLNTRDADIQMFFNANFPTGYMGATISGPQVTVDEETETITLTAGATIPTSFMRVFGYQTMSVTADASPRGTTNIPGGLGWAWRVLKPPAPFTEAVVDPEYDREQAIVLLTDGENFGGSGDGYRATFGYGAAARPDMNARLLALADDVKAGGVVIYVTQFSNSGTGLQTLLQTVASGPGSPYYYFAPDGDTLQQVFREVGNHLSELRLSK